MPLLVDVPLGPVPCKACRQPVTWEGVAWLDATRTLHRCPMAPARVLEPLPMRSRSAASSAPDPVVWVEPVWLGKLGGSILWAAVLLTVAFALVLAERA
jgi:hypothetical protein